MDGYDIYRKAMALMGIESGNFSSNEDIMIKTAFNSLVHICRDLDITAPETLSESMSLNSRQEDAVVCGVAMLLGLSMGDGAANQVFAGIYNSKRAALKKCTGKISDVIPADDGGTD